MSVGVPPFLGVAAGDASTNSVVLWTRVDQQAAVPVHAQVATASDFQWHVNSHLQEQVTQRKTTQ
jgi:phosphodiesterase/alkaline phosphatase D-like protein